MFKICIVIFIVGAIVYVIGAIVYAIGPIYLAILFATFTIMMRFICSILSSHKFSAQPAENSTRKEKRPESKPKHRNLHQWRPKQGHKPQRKNNYKPWWKKPKEGKSLYGKARESVPAPKSNTIITPRVEKTYKWAAMLLFVCFVIGVYHSFSD